MLSQMCLMVVFTDISRSFISSDGAVNDAAEFISDGNDRVSLDGLAPHEVDSLLESLPLLFQWFQM